MTSCLVVLQYGMFRLMYFGPKLSMGKSGGADCHVCCERPRAAALVDYRSSSDVNNRQLKVRIECQYC